LHARRRCLEDRPQQAGVARRDEKELWLGEHVLHGTFQRRTVRQGLVPAEARLDVTGPAAPSDGLDGLGRDPALAAHGAQLVDVCPVGVVGQQ